MLTREFCGSPLYINSLLAWRKCTTYCDIVNRNVTVCTYGIQSLFIIYSQSMLLLSLVNLSKLLICQLLQDVTFV